jgi:hypothetical protein
MILGTFWGMHLVTFWELDGNKLGIREKNKKNHCPHSKRNKLDRS